MDLNRDRAGSGVHAKLYDLVCKRALASQMASARLERTTIDLRDGTGRTGLRATGQVVIFPGFLTLYEEGVDDSEDENAKLLPRLKEGDAPATHTVSADHTSLTPTPRHRRASLVNNREENGTK